ncbi:MULTISPECIES: hypothetical protein [unclassified Streptomyces]|nr:hypothetical protein [Streptomyces sp. MnatMP-M77]
MTAIMVLPGEDGGTGGKQRTGRDYEDKLDRGTGRIPPWSKLDWP